MSQKLYLNILRFGVYLSLISVFLVFKNLLFPFITSKQIFFNILIEILLVFWAAFIIKYPEYRPRKNYVWFGLLAFFTATMLSCFTGVDFNLSFWGDVERMLGFFHIVHFLALYFIIITVFREWKDWKTLFIVSVVFSVMESIRAVTGDMSYGTIGNSAYVSGYLIFNVYFTLLLFFKEKNKTLRWLYLLALPFMFMAFKKTNTSGAIVGLGFSVMVVFFLYALLHKNKKIRIITVVSFLLLSLFTVYIFANKESDFVKKNSILRVVRGINLQKNTFQTRLISWRAAAKDFKNHPILGSGHGNYAVTFDKYFTPSFYDQTRGETYFDRAHNNVIDIASTTGGLGLISYLSIFMALAYYLINGYRRKYIGIHEFILLTGLLTAYFVQNLAVFDSLVTYIGLMITLGYIYWLTKEGEDTIFDEAKETVVKAKHKFTKDRLFDNKEIYTLALVGVMSFMVMYTYNIKPYKMLDLTIQGQRAWAAKDIKGTIDTYKEALSMNTVLDRDSRTSLIRLFAGGMQNLNKLDQEEAAKAIDFLVKVSDENVAYNQQDSLNQMMLAQILNGAATYYKNDANKFQFYSGRALEAIDASIVASPGRIPIYFQKSQIQITRGDQEGAIETLKYTTTLSDTYYDSFCHLGRTLLFYNKDEGAYYYIDKCLDLNGAHLISPVGVVKTYLNHYGELEDWPRIIKLYKQLTNLEKNRSEHWINLAKLYAQEGEKEKAIEAAGKASELEPGIAQYVNEFILSLE